MKLPVLFSFRRCPYAMRARLALALADICIEHREVVLKAKPAQLLKISPKATVPVLLLSDASVLEESLDIMRWALGEGCFSAEQSQLIACCDSSFKLALDRYKYASREELAVEGKNTEDFRTEALVFLRQLDKFLNQSKAIQLTAFECAVLPFVRQFRGVDIAWFDALGFDVLHAYMHSFLNGTLFARVMHKYPPWQEGDQALLLKF